MKPYEYQEKQILTPMEQIMRKELTGIMAVATGAGKTLCSCVLCQRLGRVPAIVAPKVTLPSWRRHLGALGMEAAFVWNIEKLKTGNTPHLIKKNNSVFLWNLDADKHIIIWDEAHGMTGTETQNAAIAKAARQLRRLANGTVIQFNLPVLLLSATLAESPLKYRDALGYLLGFHGGAKASGNWLMQHGCFINKWQGYDFPSGPRRLPYLKKLHEEVFPKFGVCVTHADIPNFPKSSVVPMPVAINAADLKELRHLYEEYERLERDAKDEAAVRDDDDIMKRNALGQVALRARQKSELAKIPMILEQVEDLLAEGMSVVVFMSFIPTLEAIDKKLKIPHGIVRGNQTAQEREDHVQRFNRDETRVILVQIQAGGTGLDLPDTRGKFPRAAILSPTTSVQLFIQAIGRTNRANSVTPSINYLLIAEGTVEERIIKRLNEKKENLEALTDSDFWS